MAVAKKEMSEKITRREITGGGIGAIVAAIGSLIADKLAHRDVVPAEDLRRQFDQFITALKECQAAGSGGGRVSGHNAAADTSSGRFAHARPKENRRN